jgi:glycosyltransferase involved in cell wall biosynthesis
MLRVLMVPDYRVDNPYQRLLAEELNRRGLNVQFTAGYRRVLPVTRAFCGQGVRPDVIHVHWLSPYLRGRHIGSAIIYRAKFLLDIAVARILGAQVVWTVHNLQPHESRWPRLDRWVRANLCRLSGRTIVHSCVAKEAVVREFSLDDTKVDVIPHGHYQGLYGGAIDRDVARTKLDIPADKVFFLFFGMIRPYKGLEELLKIWPSMPDVAVLMIAGSPASNEMRELTIELAKHPGIRTQLRRIDDNEVSALFSAADFAVFPFRDVLTSGSVALAMSYGVPVVAPRSPATSEILEGADDLLYDQAQPNGLQQALLRALRIDDKSLRARTYNACAKLSWDRIGSLTERCYERTCRSGVD